MSFPEIRARPPEFAFRVFFSRARLSLALTLGCDAYGPSDVNGVPRLGPHCVRSNTRGPASRLDRARETPAESLRRRAVVLWLPDDANAEEMQSASDLIFQSLQSQISTIKDEDLTCNHTMAFWSARPASGRDGKIREDTKRIRKIRGLPRPPPGIIGRYESLECPSRPVCGDDGARFSR